MKKKTSSILAVIFAATAVQFASEAQAVVIWDDPDPVSGITIAGGLLVSTIDVSVETSDPTRTAVGSVTKGPAGTFANLNSGTIPLPVGAAGNDYTLSVDYFVPTTTDLAGADTFWVQLNVNGANTASAGFIGAAAAGTGWNTITLTGTLDVGATDVQGFFLFADDGFSGTPNGLADPGFYIDNISLEVVPEPSSALLLGLGSFAFLRRRR